jgi:hypothetical protein
MPPFGLSDSDLKKVVEYIHARKKAVDANPGRRRQVSAADLSTGIWVTRVVEPGAKERRPSQPS